MGNVKAAAEDVDQEVAAVTRRKMTMDEVKERIVHRQSFIDKNKSVPGPLRHDAFVAPVRRRVRRARGPAPKVKLKRWKPPQPIAPAPEPKPKKEDLGPVRHYKSGRKLPAHRMVSRDEMEVILEKTNAQARSGGKHRFPFDLGIGMELVLHTQHGDVVVEITAHGFSWKGELFTSISTAWCHALKRSVSGFDLFDVTKDRNCTIRGHGVPNGIFIYRERALKPVRKPGKRKKKR